MPTLRERTEGFGLDAWKKPANQRYILRDRVRLSKFKEAIECIVPPGSIVMDVGAGWGVLSIFAAKAGAAKVYAVEVHGENVETAKRKIAKEGLSRKIELIHANSLCLAASAVPKADVIVSETLGFMGIGEGIVQMMRDAKLKWLKDHGILIPRLICLYAAAVDVPHPPESRMMMRIKPCWLRSKPRMFVHYQLGKDDTANLSGLRIPPSHAGWFAAELSQKIVLDTSPFQSLTSWEQMYFP